MIQLQPVTADVCVVSSSAHETWGRVSALDSGDLWVTWHRAAEIYAQRFDRVTLLPVGPQVHVNATTFGVQDEPEACALPGGRLVVVWSDRSSLWSGYMSAQYAILRSDGTIELSERPLWSGSSSGETSWRPLVSPTPGGGFAAAWTGGWGERPYGRVFDGLGIPLGPDAMLSPGSSAKQNSPDIAVTPWGGLFVAYLDGGSPTPKDVTARLPGWSATFDLPQTSWDVRVACSPSGRNVLAWESGGDIWSTVPGRDPVLLSSSPGFQRNAEIAFDRAGGVIVWEDRTTNTIEASTLSKRGRPSPPWTVNEHALGATFSGEIGRRTPYAWINSTGSELIIVWTSASSSNSSQDIWARRFER